MTFFTSDAHIYMKFKFGFMDELKDESPVKINVKHCSVHQLIDQLAKLFCASAEVYGSCCFFQVLVLLPRTYGYSFERLWDLKHHKSSAQTVLALVSNGKRCILEYEVLGQHASLLITFYNFAK